MNLLQEILKIDAEIAKLATKSNKLEQQYVKENCPYKVGEKIRYKPKYGMEESGIIQRVRFEKHPPFITGMASLHVEPLSENGKPKLRRSYVRLNHDSEIIKVIS